MGVFDENFYEEVEMKIKEHTVKSAIAIDMSGFIMFLATKSYLTELRENGEEVHTDLRMARAFKKPVMILFTTELSKEELKELKTYFKGLNIIGTRTIDPDYLEDDEGLGEWVKLTIYNYIRENKIKKNTTNITIKEISQVSLSLEPPVTFLQILL